MLMRLPRPYLMTLAVLFAAGMTTYSLAWMYYIRLEPPVLLGIHRAMEADAGGVRLERTVPGSAAEAAGLQPGDVIVAVNGERDNPARALSATLFRARPGDTIRLDVAREGWDQPREIVAVLGEWDATVSAPETVTRHIAGEILGAYPLPFLIVGVVLLLQRPDDRNAWLLALVFAGFIAAAPIWQFEFRIHSALLAPLLAWWAFFLSLSSAVFYYFFATFPAASPLDRRLPWLKHGLLAIGLTLGTVFAGMALTGGPLAMEGIFVPMAEGPWRGEATTAALGFFGYTVAGQLLGLTSLVMNAFGPPETRRRIRVIVAGSIAGLTPVTLVQLYAAWRGVGIEMLPFPVWSGAIMMLFLVPLSFAYAVVKHRVLEIPLLLRRSARYVFVRRGIATLALLAALGATVLFAQLFGRLMADPESPSGPLGLMTGAVLGLLLAAAGRPMLQRATTRIDRAFFRGAYDARQILQELARRSRTLTSRTELAALLERSLTEALHPASLAILLRQGGCLGVHGRETALDGEGIRALEELVRSGDDTTVAGAEAPALLARFGALVREPELAVVMRGRDATMSGAILLGPRRSEEPYSGEDRELLASVATQAGITLENIGLAETMAERMEAERLAARELDIAREVQLKLLPQKTPVLDTLECAGICLQARAVGGDYYDLLDLGPGRLGLVLADISGKGISAALLMASLQAHLRGQYAQSSADLERVLHALNRIFYESTAPSHYATLFFGIYEEEGRRLRYADCGHLPPLLRRAGGRIEQLEVTAPVVGLFDEWRCSTRELVLAPGDSLIIYSDGVCDALDDRGEEFGEERLRQVIARGGTCTAADMLQAIVDAVRRHASATPFDDRTLLVARGRAPVREPTEAPAPDAAR